MLLPVLDDDKHYWVGDDEVDKLLRRGGDVARRASRAGADHPPLPAPRPPAHARRAGAADRGRRLGRAIPTTPQEAHDVEEADDRDDRSACNDQRLAAVVAALRDGGRARRSSTSGAGRARCVRALLKETVDRPGRRRRRRRGARSRSRRGDCTSTRCRRASAQRIDLLAGRAHLSRQAAARASTRPRSWRSSSTSTRRVSPRSSGSCSATRGPRPSSSPHRTSSTTCCSKGSPTGTLRHRDHRFEWTRAEFAAWCDGVGDRHDYTVAHHRHRRRSTTTVGAPDADGGVHADEHRSRSPTCVSSRSSACRARASRRSRPGTSCRPRSSRPTSAARSSPTTRTTRPRPSAAFEVLHTIAAKRLEVGPHHRGRRDERAPRGSHAARASWPSATTCSPIAIVLDVPPEVCRERNATRPDRDFGPPRDPQPAQRAAALDQEPAPRGLPAGVRAARRRRDRRRRRRARAALDRPARPDRAVRHHRRRPRLPRRARRAAARRSAGRSNADGTDASPSRRPHRGVPRRPRRPRPGHARRCCAS